MTTYEKPSEKQLELLAHLCSGLNIDEAAKKQFIAPRSAYNMLGKSRQKMGVSSNEQFVFISLREGWLESDGDKVRVAAAFRL